MSEDELHRVDNGAGWSLALRRLPADPAARRALRPVLLVPGYGMNSFIFGFHPRGLSLRAYLASAGLEVWTVDLRGQGEAEPLQAESRDRRRDRDPGRFTLTDLAVVDVGAAISYVLRHTATGAQTLDVIGCSLGAALTFGHLACVPSAPVHTVVSMAGLVTWVDVPPLVRALFFSRRIAGGLRLRGTRAFAGVALPILGRWAPGVLSMYLHTKSTDISAAKTMIRTVEDPNPTINREIAEWIGRRELVLGGVNVSRALPGMRYPYLCVVANQDRIVPPRTAQAPFDVIGSTDKELLCVGDPASPVAHADLFISTGAQERIFAKVASFLLARS